jgi:hypothetical protein
MSMKKSNDTIGNRTRDLPAYSAMPQPTVPPLAPPCRLFAMNSKYMKLKTVTRVLLITVHLIMFKLFKMSLPFTSGTATFSVVMKFKVLPSQKSYLP